MTASTSLYRIFKRSGGAAASMRPVIIAMISAAVALTSVGVIRVSRQHEVLRLGYRASKHSDQVKRLEEVRRRLELERATLTAPDRIRRLADQLGMTSVAPDRIRIITPTPMPVKVAQQ
jgi:cell division protein FtsL